MFLISISVVTLLPNTGSWTTKCIADYKILSRKISLSVCDFFCYIIGYFMSLHTWPSCKSEKPKDL